MNAYPEKIVNEEQLEELLSRPSAEAIEMFSRIDGDLMFLGVSGKIGQSLSRMAKRTCDEAGIKKRIIGVALFESPEQQKKIKKCDIF